MDFVRWVLAGSLAVGVGIGGGALSVAVVEFIWPTNAPKTAGALDASRIVITKGDRLDRANITCLSSDGRTAKCR